MHTYVCVVEGEREREKEKEKEREREREGKRKREREREREREMRRVRVIYKCFHPYLDRYHSTSSRIHQILQVEYKIHVIQCLC